MMIVAILLSFLGIAYGGRLKCRFNFQNDDPSGDATIDAVIVKSIGLPNTTVTYFRSERDDYIDTDITSLADIKSIKLRNLGATIVPATIPKLDDSLSVVPGTEYVEFTLHYRAKVIDRFIESRDD